MATIPPTIISEIIAPAAMIPACGLLLLSSTARMNTVLGRLRAFHHERLDIWALETEAGSRRDAVRSLRLEGLEHQTHRLLRRASLLRITMLLLFVAIACNLIAMLGLGARFVIDSSSATLHMLSAIIFVAGIVVMVGSMLTSFLEVFFITETVRYEHERVEAICASECEKHKSPAGQQTSLHSAEPDEGSIL